MALRFFPAAGILIPGLWGVLALLLSLGFSASLFAEENEGKTKSATDARADIPSVVAQIESLKMIRELLKDDYGRLSKMKPEEKADFACKLLETAQSTKDAAGKYTALKEALDMAAKSNSTATVLDCLQEIQAAFRVPEAFEFKMTTLTGMANAAGAAPETLTAVANAMMGLARECWALNQFENAAKAATQAGAAAQKAKELNLVIQAKNFGDDVKLAAKEYEDAKPALELALSGADNEEANIKAGTFLCLIRGDWDKGIPCLLKIADGNPLKEMAKLEKEKGGSPEGMIELGKKWIECLEKAKLSGLQKRNAQIRARTWIEKGAAGLGGLDKVAAEKLLAGLPKPLSIEDQILGKWTGVMSVGIGSHHVLTIKKLAGRLVADEQTWGDMSLEQSARAFRKALKPGETPKFAYAATQEFKISIKDGKILFEGSNVKMIHGEGYTPDVLLGEYKEPGIIVAEFVNHPIEHSCFVYLWRDRALDTPLPLELEKGKTHSLRCLDGQPFGYKVYIPKSYNHRKPAPVLINFSPSGNAEPLLIKMAEEFGWIMAGLTKSKNDDQTWYANRDSALFDLRRRLNIDMKRVYFSGFSGGARCAAYSMCAYMDNCAGVISIGAGFFPEYEPGATIRIPIFFIVGKTDMNNEEVTNLFASEQKLKRPVKLITHPGGHEWGRPEDHEEAIRWLESFVKGKKEDAKSRQ